MVMYITDKPFRGEAGLFGGEASSLPPPVDRTLATVAYIPLPNVMVTVAIF